jgi:hypothetical protein
MDPEQLDIKLEVYRTTSSPCRVAQWTQTGWVSFLSQQQDDGVIADGLH